MNQDLKIKVLVAQKHVAICTMNQCARGGPGLVIALEDSEAIANQKAEAHKNLHRDHEKRMASVLRQHRTDSPKMPGTDGIAALINQEVAGA